MVCSRLSILIFNSDHLPEKSFDASFQQTNESYGLAPRDVLPPISNVATHAPHATRSVAENLPFHSSNLSNFNQTPLGRSLGPVEAFITPVVNSFTRAIAQHQQAGTSATIQSINSETDQLDFMRAFAKPSCTFCFLINGERRTTHLTEYCGVAASWVNMHPNKAFVTLLREWAKKFPFPASSGPRIRWCFGCRFPDGEPWHDHKLLSGKRLKCLHVDILNRVSWAFCTYQPWRAVVIEIAAGSLTTVSSQAVMRDWLAQMSTGGALNLYLVFKILAERQMRR
jgi:hypothetical protein